MSARVLVVDDEADFLVTYTRLLRRQGYEVTTVSSLATALAALARDRPSVVISDLRLSDGDGLAVVREARRGPRPAAVIVVTGFFSEEQRRAALSAGATAVLAKPFVTSALLAAVRSGLDQPSPR